MQEQDDLSVSTSRVRTPASHWVNECENGVRLQLKAKPCNYWNIVQFMRIHLIARNLVVVYDPPHFLKVLADKMLMDFL